MSGKRNKKRVRRERGHWLDGAAGDGRSGMDHYLMSPPKVRSIVCPDCGGSWQAPTTTRGGLAGGLTHHVGCPIAEGYAAAAEDDREWFDAHPEATERVRVPSMAEVQAVMLMSGQTLPDMPNGVRYQPGGEVVVTQMSPGVRKRDFRGVLMLAAVAS